MEKAISTILSEISLSEHELVWIICEHCGTIRKFEDANCKTCNNSTEKTSVYPHAEAIDMAYTILLLREVSKETQKILVNKAISRLKTDHEISSSYDDIDYLLRMISKMRNGNTSFDFAELDALISKRLKIEEVGKRDEVAFKILGGEYINRSIKPFIITCASFVELLFKDFIKSVLTDRLGKDSSEKILNIYEYKSIKDTFEFLDAILNIDMRNEMNSIESSFYEKWDSLRLVRNEIIHNNNIYVTTEKVPEVFKLAVVAVKVFAILKGKTQAVKL